MKNPCATCKHYRESELGTHCVHWRFTTADEVKGEIAAPIKTARRYCHGLAWEKASWWRRLMNA